MSLNVNALTRVAIIDSGLNTSLSKKAVVKKLCKSGHYDFSTNTESIGQDDMSHGTLVTDVFVKRAGNKDYCIMIYKVFGADNVNVVRKAIIKAYNNGAKYINLSLSINKFSSKDRYIFEEVIKRGTKVFIAAGNEETNLNKTCMIYPQCYFTHQNLFIVGAKNMFGRSYYSNYGLRVNIYDQGGLMNGMVGTSFASPRAMGTHVRENVNDNK